MNQEKEKELEWCSCKFGSCNKIIVKDKDGDGYKTDTTRRYMEVKTDGVISGGEITVGDITYRCGGMPENSIKDCEIRPRVNFKDNFGVHNNVEIKPDLTQTQPKLVERINKKRKAKELIKVKNKQERIKKRRLEKENKLKKTTL